MNVYFFKFGDEGRQQKNHKVESASVNLVVWESGISYGSLTRKASSNQAEPEVLLSEKVKEIRE